ncbi:MAG: hypothetical protein LWX11_10370, partial [Firmicutes bacterium]|nr:hypothetical protein [Bacillota bacterium]
MSTRFTVRGLAWGLSLFAVSSLVAQGFPDTSAAKNWAWDQVKSRTYYRKDARGQTIWQGVKFLDLSAQEQRDHLLSLLNESESTRRAALLVLGDRPLSQWAEQALATRHRDEVVLFLYQKGYKSSGPEPYAYLGAGKELERPWTHGLGLHLEGAQWRFQWIPSPTLLPKLEWRATLPKALERAPQPSALVRLSHLKPGLARLQQLAGGEGGLASTLAQGSRMGFFLRHIEPWLKQAAPALEPLAKREAWVLHYGVARE